MKLTRRSFLAGSGTAVFAALVRLDPAGASDGDPTQPIELRAGPAEQTLLGDQSQPTRIWAYNGTSPGPLLRVRKWEELRVRLKNDLDQPTTVHWHGIRLENAMDGVPGLTQTTVEPGAEFDYAFVAPDAGTYWYHSHDRSWEQVARGLHGILIVDEEDPLDVDHDLLLVVDDWRLNDEAQIEAESFGHMMDLSHAGRLGNLLTVNGKGALAEFGVRAGDRVRLRLCNVANARIFELRLDDLTADIVALDGQPVEPIATANSTITLAPAQRTDLVFDVDGDGDAKRTISAVFGNEAYPVGRMIVEPTASGQAKRRNEPFRLPGNTLLGEIDLENARHIELLMRGGAMGGMPGAMMGGRHMGMRDLVDAGMIWAFNGVVGRTDTPLFTARRGEAIVLSIVNDTAWPHAMHWHGHHALITKSGSAEREGTWRDTVLSLPGETMEVAFNADNPGKWLLHCHMLEHQAAGMSTWFEVT